VALRLATVGREVLVCVTEIVCVAVGVRGMRVTVTDENAVLVASSVAGGVEGIEVDVTLQATEVMINRIGKISFGFMN
jgi:hypothetical protein